MIQTVKRPAVAWAAFLLALAPLAAVAPADASPRSKAPVIYEDDPRWDCRTMGNRRCGATVADPKTGEPIAVVLQYNRAGVLRSVALQRP